MIARELNGHLLWSSSSIKIGLSALLCKTRQVGSVLSVAVAEVTRFDPQGDGKLIVCSCANLLW